MRRAFTLIELLIVIAIITILMSLMLVSIGPLRERFKRVDTGRRMQQIIAGIQHYQSGAQDVPTAVLSAIGYDLRHAPLRHIISELTTVHGLNLRTARREEHLPPNLGVRWEKQPDPNAWPFPDTSVDNVITFRDRQLPLARPRAWATWRILDFYDDLVGSRPDADHGQKAFDVSVQRWTYRRGNESPLGETLDRTLEVQPDRIRPPTWYLQRWPNLIETIPVNAGVVQFVQTAWPVSDWDQDTPGTIPPIWAWPWGHRIISRIQGTQVDQIEPHTLSDLSPLGTIPLMQLAGILPPGAEGADLYRQDRSPRRAWNDRWGRPLVVAFAAFVAPRYDFDDNDTFRHAPSGQTFPKVSRNMRGGRDFLLTRAQETYGYHRSVYLASGAIGPTLRTPLPESWTDAHDAVILRTLWHQIREVGAAADWDEHAFADPPWQGWRARRLGNEHCLISAPAEIR